MLKIIITPDHGYARLIKKAAAIGAKHTTYPIPSEDQAKILGECDWCTNKIWRSLRGAGGSPLCQDCQEKHEQEIEKDREHVVTVHHIVEAATGPDAPRMTLN